MNYLLSDSINRAAERFPDHNAFRCDGEKLSYAQLAEQTDSLADLLLEEGLQRGDRVGIFMSRCLKSAVAVYGILKAGAVYVPIDPYTPTAGVRRLIADCGIRHLICDSFTQSTVQQISMDCGDLDLLVGIDNAEATARTVSWDAAMRFTGCHGTRPRMVEDDLAYIMYSSGSTGRPKGIMHTHRSGLSYAELSVRTYNVTPEDRIANHSPLHFDMSTFGYFSGPFAAATTILISEPYTKMPASLSQLMAAERLTIWYSVPGALIHLLERGVLEQRDLTSLRWVLFGGEPLAVNHLRSLMRHWPDAAFSNVYGPAEVNQCTCHHIPSLRESADRTELPSERIPIGRVWDNTEGIVLDENDQPVSPGNIGELMIRSPTMMHGYWKRPDLNAEAFYRQCDTGGFQKVFYRTGDLVRVLDDDRYVFLGRRDRQIKTRGHRVELDDVESCLGSHSDVLEAAAIAVADGPHARVIEAMVIVRDNCVSDEGSLLRHLNQNLPAYAVPESIEIRPVLPRTATGKIDRSRLQLEADQRRNGIAVKETTS